jgi:hypothetical protein
MVSQSMTHDLQGVKIYFTQGCDFLKKYLKYSSIHT